MSSKNNPLINPKTGKPIVGNVRRKVIEKDYNWGLYVYKKSDGKWFTDGNGSILNIPSLRGDISQIAKLKKAAIHYGDEHSEQMDRFKQGLIPSMNDLGAIHAAQQTLNTHGRDIYENG
jgi:hypothetical protein